ncbi:MAG: PEP-CTERM sorting domain-containing protein [Pirellulales bacterium]
MSLLRFGLALGLALACLPRDAAAITTNLGQTWDLAPDAWTRGNDADTSWFGWDVLEGTHPVYPAPPDGFFRILDDSTPDVGGATTALTPRLYQGNDGVNDPLPTTSGHRSGSGNYYSGFDNAALDHITAVAPASDVGGFTTVVLQVVGQPGNGVSALEFAMDGSWTKVKDLFAINENGAGMYWQEWTAPGNDLPLSMLMTSTETSRGLDAFQVDTFWTSERNPRINAISAIPEPGSVTLAGLAVVGALLVLRRNRAA